jgi:hypothetical protein
VLEFSLELEISADDTDIKVTANDTVMFNGRLAQGIHTVNLDILTLTSTNTISVTFSNKSDSDTVCDTAGNIIKDKFVLIRKFVVKDVDLFQDVEFFYTKLTYVENNTTCGMKPGFWFNNSRIEFSFESPFLLWYGRNTKNFSVPTARIVTQSTKIGTRIPHSVDYKMYHQKLVDLLCQY